MTDANEATEVLHDLAVLASYEPNPEVAAKLDRAMRLIRTVQAHGSL